MNPTDLIHSVTFQEQVNTQDPDTGENATTWSNVTGLVNVPARCLTGPSPEAIRAGAKYDDQELRVGLWWFDGLITSWRVVWEGQPYDIVSAVLDWSGRREWHLVCRKIGDGT